MAVGVFKKKKDKNKIEDELELMEGWARIQFSHLLFFIASP